MGKVKKYNIYRTRVLKNRERTRVKNYCRNSSQVSFNHIKTRNVHKYKAQQTPSKINTKKTHLGQSWKNC